MGLLDGTAEIGTISCPEEYITSEKFINKYNIEGYKIARKAIAHVKGKIQWERPETVIFYKLVSVR